ncbi:hypothetical protein CEXT_150741 [Caerostris extrusa]|uniref:Uncharacterized protein n=1 Tax=Caerostris extrusa TaxID=172846 RepID=A0AAV4P7U1_CAEEX|nr:hypothetical protein CEXT_150741 [Caerostris extrusa]
MKHSEKKETLSKMMNQDVDIDARRKPTIRKRIPEKDANSSTIPENESYCKKCSRILEILARCKRDESYCKKCSRILEILSAIPE